MSKSLLKPTYPSLAQSLLRWHAGSKTIVLFMWTAEEQNTARIKLIRTGVLRGKVVALGPGQAIAVVRPTDALTTIAKDLL